MHTHTQDRWVSWRFIAVVIVVRAIFRSQVARVQWSPGSSWWLRSRLWIHSCCLWVRGDLVFSGKAEDVRDQVALVEGVVEFERDQVVG